MDHAGLNYGSGLNSSKIGTRAVAPLYRLDVFVKGTGGSKEPVRVTTIVTADKDKLKAKRRKLEERYDILGPYQIARRSKVPLLPLAVRTKFANARKPVIDARRARAVKLDRMQRDQSAIRNPKSAI